MSSISSLYERIEKKRNELRQLLQRSSMEKELKEDPRATTLCALLYETSCDLCEYIATGRELKHIRERLGINVSYKKNGEVTHICFDRLLPFRYVDFKESQIIIDYYKNPLRNELFYGLKRGDLQRYQQRIALCICNFFSSQDQLVDYHDFEVKPVIDAISGLLFPDDSPKFLSLHIHSFVCDSNSHSEIYLVPEDDFPLFFENMKKKNSRAIEHSAGNLSWLQEIGSLMDVYARSMDNLKDLYQNQRIKECLLMIPEVLNNCVAIYFQIKKASIFSRKEDRYQRKVTRLPVYAEKKPDNTIIIKLEALIPRNEKGTPSDRRKAMNRIMMTGLENIEKRNDPSDKELTICFIHHFGRGQRLIDYDNFATEYYALAVKEALCGSKEISLNYNMDCVVNPEESSYTEIRVCPGRNEKAKKTD